ncbi:sensor histidine kinase [Paenibacillus campi]|uniref:sensor histidine kinase n=1 Tax=Paenibacillus campi TaxID=3106031 RepID=UPI002AFFE1BA|nr:sensor histidine kinase [Paenibacillus sp. SGZ-1009]
MTKARLSVRIRHKLQQSKLTTLMVTCFIVFNLLLVSVIVWLAYQSFAAVTFAEISKARLALLNESTQRGFDFITNVSSTAYSLASNRELSDLLYTSGSTPLQQIYQRRELARMIEHTLIVNDGISSIELYTDAFNSIPMTAANHIYSVDSVRDAEWFHRLRQADAAWVPLQDQSSGQSLIGYAQRIFNSHGETVAYVLIRLSRDDIVQRFADLPLSQNSQVLLIDTAGQTIMRIGGEGIGAPNRSGASTDRTDASTANHIAIHPEWLEQHTRQAEDGYAVVSTATGKQLVLYSRPAMLQWRLVQTIPVHTLLAPVQSAGWTIIGVALFGLLCSALLAYWFVRRIVRPLQQLIQHMKRLEEGDFDTRITLSFTEEYARLAYGFNHMASRLTELMNRVRAESRAKREAQTGLLEAQIKPHFLYNTLDMIHWRALDYEARDISRMIVQLSKLLRIGLSGGRLFICVRDELEHARCYVSIQAERLPFAIAYEEQVHPLVRGCYIPKIILQPFIENAVMHACPDDDVLRIKVDIQPLAAHPIQSPESGLSYEHNTHDRDRSDGIMIRITDNGQGLPDDWQEEQCSGIGIHNVQQRIRLYCGNEYGVQLANAAEGGTVVTITLPRIDNEEQLRSWLGGESA